MTQDTFTRAYERLARLKQPDSFGGWIARIAFTRCQDHIRRHGRETPTANPYGEGRDPPVPPEQVEFERRHDLAALVADALQQLPDSYRVPLVMQYMGNASVREIGEALMLSEVAAERCLGRARKLVRQYLQRTGRTEDARDLLRPGVLLVPWAASIGDAVLARISGRPAPEEPSQGVSTAKVAGVVAGGATLLEQAATRRVASRQAQAHASHPPGGAGRLQLFAITALPHAWPAEGSGAGRPAPGRELLRPIGAVPTGDLGATRILVAAREADDMSGESDIYAMAPDGGGRVNLTRHPAPDDNASWSRDGRHIVFASSRGRPRDERDIYVMDADGGRVRRLTDGQARYEAPKWSPVDDRILLSSDRDGTWNIFEIHADGTGLRSLNPSPGRDIQPSWSPDGRRVLFGSDRTRPGGHGAEEIYVMQADGTAVENLTNNDENDHSAAFAPDGARVVFQSYRDGNNEIYLMDADGGGQVRLTRHPAEDTFPTFSPNGTRVLFQSGRDGGSEFFSMRVDGSDVRRVTTGAYYQDGPSAWSPFPADPANSVTPTDTLLSSSR